MQILKQTILVQVNEKPQWNKLIQSRNRQLKENPSEG